MQPILYDPEWAQLSRTQTTIGMTLMTRACFGGIKGDMIMLGAARFWRSRFYGAETEFGFDKIFFQLSKR